MIFGADKQQQMTLDEQGLTSLGAPVHEDIVDQERENIAETSARIRHSNRTFTIILFLLISISLLVVMFVGVSSYKSLVASRVENQQTRLVTTLLATNVRMGDEANAVQVGKGPEGEALVLVERTSTGTYETRFYLYNGYIVQEYAVAGSNYQPGGATQLVQSKNFSFQLEGNLVKITTDSGTTQVALRSSQNASDVEGGA